jgi:hypothetical protein
MRNKFSSLLGCLTLVLFALFYNAPVQAEDTSPPMQTTFMQDELPSVQIQSIVVSDVPVTFQTMIFQVHAPYDFVPIMAVTESPGFLTTQALNDEDALGFDVQKYFSNYHPPRQATSYRATNTALTGIDIDRWCSLKQDYLRCVPAPSNGNQNCRHVLRC